MRVSVPAPEPVPDAIVAVLRVRVLVDRDRLSDREAGAVRDADARRSASGRRSGNRRPAAEDLRGVVLEHGVRDADVADVTTRARVRNPRPRRIADGSRAAERRRIVVDHVVVRVPGRRRRRHRVAQVGEVRPVLERGREADRAVGPEVVVGVRHGLPVPVRIEARERAQDPAPRVRDQNCVVVRVERAVVLQEVQQMRHLLEIRRDVRVVPQEVDVVELQIDDVLDLSLVAELASGRTRSRLRALFSVNPLRSARERGRRHH